MPLREGVMPKDAIYKKGKLVVVYNDSKRVYLRAVTRKERAKLYDLNTLATVSMNETFNMCGIRDMSFKNCNECDTMTYMQIRPWVYNIKRCTSKYRCGLNGHIPSSFVGCCV